MKLTTEQKEKIVKARTKVEELQNMADAVYTKLVEDIGFDKYPTHWINDLDSFSASASNPADWLFDIVHNGALYPECENTLDKLDEVIEKYHELGGEHGDV